MKIAFYAFIFLVGTEYIGLQKYIPLIKALHLSTLLAITLSLYVVFKNGIIELLRNKQGKLLFLFLAFTAATVLYAFVQMRAYQEFRVHLAHFCLFVSGFYLLSDFKKINVFSICFILFHFYIVVNNFDELGSGSRIGRFDAGYFMRDGNDLAWGLNIAFPLAIFIFNYNKSKILKAFAILAIFFFLTGIVGTQSRGGSIALFISGFYFILKSKKRAVIILITIFIGTVILFTAPDTYFDRLISIKNYEQDNSASNRIAAWSAATKMALENPFGVGAGNFSSVYGRYYRNDLNPYKWGSGRWISPHSIYFSVLAEYGFPGLLLLLYIIITNYKSVFRLEKKKKIYDDTKGYIESFFVALNMSLTGYAIGGLFLGGITYPHLYVISLLIASTHNAYLKEIK